MFAVLGVEYCTGYVDDSNTWRKGFYCPKREDGVSSMDSSKDIFCCGTQTSKYCCERKEGFTTSHTGLYVSYVTLISVTLVTFFTTVLLTALAIHFCRRYWKARLQSPDRRTHSEEDCDHAAMTPSSGRRLPASESGHLYRMTCSSSNAPLVPFSASFHSNPGNGIHSPSSAMATVSLINPLLQSYLSPAIAEQQQLLLQQQHHNQYRMLSQSPSDTGTSTTTTTTTGRSDGAFVLRSLSIMEPPSYPPPPYESAISIREVSGENENSSPAVNHMNARNSLNLTSNNNNISGDISSSGRSPGSGDPTSRPEDGDQHTNLQYERRKRNQQTLWRKLSQ